VRSRASLSLRERVEVRGSNNLSSDMIRPSEEIVMADEPKAGFTRRDLVRGALVGAVAT